MTPRDLKSSIKDLAALDQRPLKPLEMVAAVEIEKIRRLKKGFSFHCIVADYDQITYIWRPPNEGGRSTIKNTHKDQLNYVLAQLEKFYRNGSLPNGSRVQLLVHQGTHWTAVDLEFRNALEGGISCLIIDAAADARWRDVKAAIKKYFPMVNLYACAGGIQTDAENCSSFALHHVFQSSKIEDLFSYLSTHKKSFVLEGENNYTLTMFQLPPHLVMTTQGSRRILESYFEDHPHLEGYTIKNQPFKNFILAQSKMIQVPNAEHLTNPDVPPYRPSLMNHFIYLFREKQKGKINAFSEEKPEIVLKKLVGYHIQHSLVALRKEILPAYKKRSATSIMAKPASTEIKTELNEQVAPIDRNRFFAIKPAPASEATATPESKQKPDGEKKSEPT